MCMSFKAQIIADAAQEQFQTVDVDGKFKWGMNSNGTVFTIEEIPAWNCLLIEFANSIEEAQRGLREDGEQHDLEQSVELLINEIVDEINNLPEIKWQ